MWKNKALLSIKFKIILLIAFSGTTWSRKKPILFNSGLEFENLQVTGKLYQLNLIFGIYNLEQNIWNKVKKASISAFAHFLTAISGGENGHYAMYPPKFEIFLTFPNFLRS